MSGIHYSIIGTLVIAITKRFVPWLVKKFKLVEFDEVTKTRVKQQSYPWFYVPLYWVWVLLLISSGFIVLVLFYILAARSPQNATSYIWMGLINMIGSWFILGALLDAIFWFISPKKFRDYIQLKLIETKNGYPIEAQIKVLLKLGFIYYIALSPAIIYFLIKLNI